VDIFDRISRDMVVMELKTPTGEMATVRATPEHPFMTLDGGWIHAGSLKAGDFVFDIDGAAPVTVESISFEIVSEKVYNFEVEGLHNYFVSEEGLLSHNRIGSGGGGGRGCDDGSDDECKREWRWARKFCAEKRGDSDLRNATPAWMDIERCAKGLVSKRCGGNAI
jgi:pretoxin HINT domain-containing protein